VPEQSPVPHQRGEAGGVGVRRRSTIRPRTDQGAHQGVRDQKGEQLAGEGLRQHPGRDHGVQDVARRPGGAAVRRYGAGQRARGEG
jgi:hypothetical protein